MANTNPITHFQKLLLPFITEQNPLLAMPQWLTEQFMQLEVGSGTKYGGRSHPPKSEEQKEENEDITYIPPCLQYI